MQTAPERNLFLHELHGMMDRLCSPDLTAAEAKVLRPQLETLLDRIQDYERSRVPAPAHRSGVTVS